MATALLDFGRDPSDGFIRTSASAPMSHDYNRCLHASSLYLSKTEVSIIACNKSQFNIDRKSVKGKYMARYQRVGAGCRTEVVRVEENKK
jgi:hypothetical protein